MPRSISSEISTAVGSLAAARDTYRAAFKLLLADPLPDRTEVALQYERIALGQAKAGDAAGSRQTILRSRMGPQERGQYFTRIAQLQAEPGDTGGALMTVQASPLGGPYRSVSIAWAQARAGQTADALRTVDAIKQGHGSDSADFALREVASAQTERGDFAGVLQTLASIRNDQIRTQMSIVIAVAQIRAGAGPGPGHPGRRGRRPADGRHPPESRPGIGRDCPRAGQGR